MEDEQSKPWQTIFFALVVSISGITTFLFYATYVEALVPASMVRDPMIRALITGAVGLLLLEGAALLWQRVLTHGSTRTAEQQQIADVGSIVALVGGVGMSISYLILSTNLITDQGVIEMAGILGLLVIVIATAIQFICVWLFVHHSFSATQRRDQLQATAEAMNAYRKRQKAHWRDAAQRLADEAFVGNRPHDEQAVLVALQGMHQYNRADAPPATAYGGGNDPWIPGDESVSPPASPPASPPKGQRRRNQS